MSRKGKIVKALFGKGKGIFGKGSSSAPLDEFSDPTSPLLPSGSLIVKAMFDFTARDERQISFKKGDQLEILAKSWQDWWRAQNMGTTKIGYIPASFVEISSSLESNDWFFASISRQEAEKLLIAPCNTAGAFLVRNSNAGHGQTLSIRVANKIAKEDQVEHYRICLTNAGMFYVKSCRSFMSVNDVVDFYLSDHPDNELRGAMTHPCLKETPDIPNLTVGDEWEIDPNDLQYLKILGEGNYGEVWRGKWKNVADVAIKTLKTEVPMTQEAFMEEATVMKSLRHDNILILYGVCSKDTPRLIVTEFMNGGALIDLLKSPKGKKLQLADLIHISSQIAKAMAYLEGKRLVHRDLAARNVLVGETLRCKVADFGLSRILIGDEYNSSSDIALPLRWLAPETLRKIFTVKSDVWAYSIMLTEIFSYGKRPYADIPNQDIYPMVCKGHQMTKPEACPIPVYELMTQCWHLNKDRRPTFAHIVDFFENFNIGQQIYSEAENMKC